MAVPSTHKLCCPAAPVSDDMKWIRRQLIACACDLTLLRRRLLAARPQDPTGDSLGVVTEVLAAVEEAFDAAVVRIDAEQDLRYAEAQVQRGCAA